MGYWVSQAYGLWCVNPCPPTWWTMGAMGCRGLWVISSMGYDKFDCTAIQSFFVVRCYPVLSAAYLSFQLVLHYYSVLFCCSLLSTRFLLLSQMLLLPFAIVFVAITYLLLLSHILHYYNLLSIAILRMIPKKHLRTGKQWMTNFCNHIDIYLIFRGLPVTTISATINHTCPWSNSLWISFLTS
jgi:hypothetical protein